MILVDTSVIVAWLDSGHENHRESMRALVDLAGRETLAVSSVTYAELAAGGRTQEGIDDDLKMFRRIDLGFDAAWRAGLAFARAYPKAKDRKPVLPDFFIRAQAAALGCKHLTNDRRRMAAFPEVEFIFPAG